MIYIKHLYNEKDDTPKTIMLSALKGGYVLSYLNMKNPCKIPCDKGKWHIKYKQ